MLNAELIAGEDVKLTIIDTSKEHATKHADRLINEGFDLTEIKLKEEGYTTEILVYEGNKWRKNNYFDIICNYPETKFKKLDGFDSAILGVVVIDNTPRLLYDTATLIDIFYEQGMTKPASIEKVIIEIQAKQKELAFTDFPTHWK